MIKDKTGVLIIMPVYNHSKFVRTAINSVLMQKTIAPNELFISDDHSLDDTFEICMSYTSTNKLCIVVNREPENIGASNNGKKNKRYALQSGWKYIAILEGDDYWTDPLKLQKQVDFLEANPDYSAVFGSTEVLQENPNKSSRAFSNFGGLEDCDLMLEDVLKEKMPVHISSMLFRREVLSPAFLKQNKGVVPGDRYIAAGCFIKGKVRYLAQPFSVYRRHSSGISQTINHYGIGLHAGNVHMLFRLLKLFPQNDRGVLVSYLTWRLNETAYEFRRISGFSVKIKALKLIYRFYPFQLFVKFFLRETLIQLFPRLIQRIHAPSQPA